MYAPAYTDLSMRSARDRSEGFSLIEVMIVVVIMGIVTGQMFMVLSSQRRTFLVNNQALNTQETARVVSDLISFDTRMAGFMVPTFAGVSSEDGGPNNPDRFCVSDPSFALTPLDGTPSPSMDNTGEKFVGVAGIFAAGTSLGPVGTLDVDGDGVNDFAANAGVIISDGVQDAIAPTQTFCDRIDSITGAPGFFTINLENGGSVIPPGTLVSIIPAIVYEQGPIAGVVASNATSLSRNGIPLSNSVDDLQIRYWVDSQTPDGLMAGAEWPIDDLNNGAAWMDLNAVRRIQISIDSVGTQGEQQEGVQFNRRGRPAVANRAAGLPDDLPRRSFSVDVLPRNLAQ